MGIHAPYIVINSVLFPSVIIWFKSVSLNVLLMDDIGKVNSESPTLNFIPSTIERVNGIFIVKVVPSSCLLLLQLNLQLFQYFYEQCPCLLLFQKIQL